ncbi:hypothetical protein [Bifidobacterium sp. ESL0704]|uniref:tetratricopeptide repeat protein n=1 Tax=Bifidobacterium sp. ESL0704 TaxID=2983219 RepID=UPI0023F9E369|nr:hypothetical protein [Bifidobacterium sp. ESL0704]WEV52599.1 hypothetical protein OZX64_06890 [Bifidobacterium sp. ESL0704]
MILYLNIAFFAFATIALGAFFFTWKLRKKSSPWLLVIAVIVYVIMIATTILGKANFSFKNSGSPSDLGSIITNIGAVVGIISSIVPGIGYLWKQHKTKKSASHLFGVFKPTELRPADVGVTQYKEGLYIRNYRTEDAFEDAFEDALKNVPDDADGPKPLIVSGRDQIGKSRAVYEKLHSLDDNKYRVIVPYLSICDKDSNYRDALNDIIGHIAGLPMTVIVVLDNVNVFMNANLLLDVFCDEVKRFCKNTKIKGIMFIMTVEDEYYETLEASSEHCIELAQYFHDFRILTNLEAKKIQPNLKNRETFDGTPGSLNKEVSSRIKAFNRLSDSVKYIYFIFQRFYSLNVTPIPYEAVKPLALRRGLAEVDYNNGIEILKKKKYLENCTEKNCTVNNYEAKRLNNYASSPDGTTIQDKELIQLLLSKEEFYPYANQAANKLLSSGDTKQSNYIFSQTLLKSDSNNPLAYVYGAMYCDKNGDYGKAVNILKSGIGKDMRGGVVIRTKLGEIYAEHDDTEVAIQVLKDSTRLDKVGLRNLTSQVLKKDGAVAALNTLESRRDDLNGDHDNLIKSSIHEMFIGHGASSEDEIYDHEQKAADNFNKWLETYSDEFASQKQFNKTSKRKWDKRLSLAAMILRVYSVYCKNVGLFRISAGVLLHDFRGVRLPSFNPSEGQYFVAYRYFLDSQSSNSSKDRGLAYALFKELLGYDNNYYSSSIYNTLCYICWNVKDYEQAYEYGRKATATDGSHKEEYSQNWLNFAVAAYGLSKSNIAELLLQRSQEACEKYCRLVYAQEESKKQKGINRYKNYLSQELIPGIPA